jgi:hypothetical protein
VGVTACPFPSVALPQLAKKTKANAAAPHRHTVNVDVEARIMELWQIADHRARSIASA